MSIDCRNEFGIRRQENSMTHTCPMGMPDSAIVQGNELWRDEGLLEWASRGDWKRVTDLWALLLPIALLTSWLNLGLVGSNQMGIAHITLMSEAWRASGNKIIVGKVCLESTRLRQHKYKLQTHPKQCCYDCFCCTHTGLSGATPGHGAYLPSPQMCWIHVTSRILQQMTDYNIQHPCRWDCPLCTLCSRLCHHSCMDDLHQAPCIAPTVFPALSNWRLGVETPYGTRDSNQKLGNFWEPGQPEASSLKNTVHCWTLGHPEQNHRLVIHT